MSSRVSAAPSCPSCSSCSCVPRLPGLTGRCRGLRFEPCASPCCALPGLAQEGDLRLSQAGWSKGIFRAVPRISRISSRSAWRAAASCRRAAGESPSWRKVRRARTACQSAASRRVRVRSASTSPCRPCANRAEANRNHAIVSPGVPPRESGRGGRSRRPVRRGSRASPRSRCAPSRRPAGSRRHRSPACRPPAGAHRRPLLARTGPVRLCGRGHGGPAGSRPRYSSGQSARARRARWSCRRPADAVASSRKPAGLLHRRPGCAVRRDEVVLVHGGGGEHVRQGQLQPGPGPRRRRPLWSSGRGPSPPRSSRPGRPGWRRTRTGGRRLGARSCPAAGHGTPRDRRWRRPEEGPAPARSSTSAGGRSAGGTKRTFQNPSSNSSSLWPHASVSRSSSSPAHSSASPSSESGSSLSSSSSRKLLVLLVLLVLQGLLEISEILDGSSGATPGPEGTVVRAGRRCAAPEGGPGRRAAPRRWGRGDATEPPPRNRPPRGRRRPGAPPSRPLR